MKAKMAQIISVGICALSFLISPCLLAQQCAPVPAGLVSWWRAEANATDNAGTNHGYLATSVTYAPGVVGQAFSFDGNSSYVMVPDSPSLRLTNEVTLELWYKDTGSPAGHHFYGLMAKRAPFPNGCNYGINFYAGSPSVLQVYFQSGFDTYQVSASPLPETNVFHHLAAVYRQQPDNQVQIKTYLNGALVKTDILPGNLSYAINSTPLIIGGDNTAEALFVGLIDEPSVYARALTDLEIEAIYKAGSAGKCDAPTPPSIFTQPADQTGYVAGTSTFNVLASGTAPLSYQWSFNGTNIDGATNAALVLTNLTLEQAGVYAVLVTNAYGSVLSSNAALTVSYQPPFILTQPASKTASPGSTASLNVTAGGSPVLYYQWTFNDAPVEGATAATLTLTNVSLANNGRYAVQITNAWGSVTSSTATLTVIQPPALVLLEDRTTAAAGQQVTIPVYLVANGNENAIALSLNFDRVVLSFSGITAGSGAPNASLLVNTNQIGTGRVGFALALAPGSTFPAGTQQVAVATFKTGLSRFSQTTHIFFSDAPVQRQLTDASGTPLTVSFGYPADVFVSAAVFEADATPRPNGDKFVNINDWVLVGRYVARLDSPTNGMEFQRADCAPLDTAGDGAITVTDWVQAGRFAVGLDPLAAAGGPTNETSPFIGKGRSPGPAPRAVRIDGGLLIPGQTGAFSVSLDAFGNENALGFSVGFDTNLVKFENATLGSGASGATLNINSTKSSSGKVAFVLALGSGSSFAAGPHELLKVQFRATPAASGTGSLTLTDDPVRRQVSDATAHALESDYVPGLVQVVAPPSLSISQAEGNVTLAWPSWASNYLLQASSDLSVAASWTDVAVARSISTNSISAVLPLTNSAVLYRLRAQ